MIVRASSLATPTTEETPSLLHSRPYHIQIRSNRRQNIESTTVRLNSRLTNLEAQYILIIYSTARARMPIWVHAEPKLFERIGESLQNWINTGQSNSVLIRDMSSKSTHGNLLTASRDLFACEAASPATIMRPRDELPR